MPHSHDLVVLGDANPDVVVGPLDEPLAFGQHEQLVDSGALTLGGSAAITACGAARLGLSVALVGRVGDDEAGHFVRDALAARGVDTAALGVDPELPTPLTVVVTRGDGPGSDRAILTSPGTLATTSSSDVPPGLLAAARHVHAASYFLMPRLARTLPALLRTARCHGATTSLDTNDDPAGRWDPDGMAALLPVTDFLLPNAAEAVALAGTGSGGSPAEAAARLAARGPVTVVKNGADGALAHDGRGLVHTGGITVTPRDTVGAGDSFDAGFIAANLAGLPLPEALELASVCGALSTRAHGGTPAQPTWEEARAHTAAPLATTD
ncbi:carbohydrate kinase family protein [Streptomyces smyrnaeus]|uniref:carbohydrate kinase family protein n=1 Tax=Streptomyces TaxID=1883 RepID=UPI000C19B99E|nr:MULTISPECIES: carbohydrate kinase family protein [unclassified Streptomyces]MBQ0867159.1 carbohydrate kinase family protein [Streptomyces sp. RK75]MBQ1121134.1 carbohydrate kinase family protein [Streptomyces sp. B15]